MKDIKEEVVFDQNDKRSAKPSSEQKIGIAGGIAGFIRTAIDQINGTGEYKLKPWEKPGETTVDKVKDQIIGAGNFESKSSN